ncbi:MAG TPA: hypothetical protein VMU68_08870 [Acidimicrobiales bacterium]|nr:hypothetical protein [Acidimicrobiales bacterium]
MAAASKSTFKINLGLFFAELICITAFITEIKRALGGNTLSWAYVFEWPLLSVYAVYMWHKLLKDERGEGSSRPVVYDEEDPALDAWNAYLESVHQRDRPSAPDRHDV